MCTNPLSLKSSSAPARRLAAGLPYISVSCGQCIECRIGRKRMWMARMYCEQFSHTESSFLTLTLRDEHLAWGHSMPSLDPKQLELFLKRIRIRFNGQRGKPFKRLRFFACGEYGDKNYRPHYHVILFGHDFKDDRFLSRTSKSDFPLYESPTLDSLWPFGQALIGDVTPDSMEYTAGYTVKKITGKLKGFYEQAGIHPEFARMSRNPGLGAEYYDRYFEELFRHDSLSISDFKLSIPSYFNRKYKALNPYRYETIKTIRQLKSEESDRNTPRSNSARKAIALSRLNSDFMRDIE